MAGALHAESIAIEAVAVGGQGRGETAGVDDDGVGAPRAGAARDAVERPVVGVHENVGARVVNGALEATFREWHLG